LRIRLNRAACVGHGRCYELAPDLFTDDERGHCVIIEAAVPEPLEKQARRGEANCPEGAIEIDED
jgi:ferredoxin